MNTITFRIGESLKVELPKLDKAVVPTELNQEIRCYARVAVELALASMGTSDAESFTNRF
jgi:hypothetical protein